MNIWVLLLVGAPILVIIIGALRTILSSRFPFVEPFEPQNREGFIALGILSAGTCAIYAWSIGAQVEAFDFMGIKGTIRREVKQEVPKEVNKEVNRIDTFIRELYNARKTEEHPVTINGSQLTVRLREEPLPNTVMIFRGTIVVPPTDFKVNGRTVSWVGPPAPASAVIQYYPKLPVRP